MPMPKAKRRSTDRMERIEWQLDQIRSHTQVVALVSVLIMIGFVLAVFW